MLPRSSISYEGSLSLEFPEASKRCRGGILADQMGLGKTIMLAALIHTNRVTAAAPASSSDDPDMSDNSEASYVPSPVKTKNRQRRLDMGGNLRAAATTDGSRPHATLVVVPMSLIAQWRDELERTVADPSELSVLVYCACFVDVMARLRSEPRGSFALRGVLGFADTRLDGTGRSNLREELDTGIDVVLTTYGTLASEYKNWAGEDGEKPKKAQAKSGLYSGAQAASRVCAERAVEFYRIILDEAHTIRSRTTLNAKAAFALRGRRRWCLTGTPIVKCGGVYRPF